MAKCLGIGCEIQLLTSPVECLLTEVRSRIQVSQLLLQFRDLLAGRSRERRVVRGQRGVAIADGHRQPPAGVEANQRSPLLRALRTVLQTQQDFAVGV